MHQFKHLSMDVAGCRLTQKLLEVARDEWKIIFAKEMVGSVAAALDNPHANHVLQAIVQALRPAHSVFILDEIIDIPPPQHESKNGPASIARHRYGCRILERLIEHFSVQEETTTTSAPDAQQQKSPAAKLDAYIEEVLKETKDLLKHPYGNFVLQHILEHGTPSQRRTIIDTLKEKLDEFAMDTHASSVLDKALSYGDIEEQRELSWAIINCKVHPQHSQEHQRRSMDLTNEREAKIGKDETPLLALMAGSRNGFAATQRLFRVAQGDAALTLQAFKQLQMGESVIVGTKHGKALINSIIQQFQLPMPERRNTSNDRTPVARIALGPALDGCAGGGQQFTSPAHLRGTTPTEDAQVVREKLEFIVNCLMKDCSPEMCGQGLGNVAAYSAQQQQQTPAFNGPVEPSYQDFNNQQRYGVMPGQMCNGWHPSEQHVAPGYVFCVPYTDGQQCMPYGNYA